LIIKNIKYSVKWMKEYKDVNNKYWWYNYLH
jgi:hypothetical protein